MDMSNWTKDLAVALSAMKDEAADGKKSYSRIHDELRDKLGVFAISTAQGVNLYHRSDSIPETPDLVNVLAMIEIHGKQLSDLPDHVEAEIRARLQGLRDLLARNAWTSRAH